MPWQHAAVTAHILAFSRVFCWTCLPVTADLHLSAQLRSWLARFIMLRWIEYVAYGRQGGRSPAPRNSQNAWVATSSKNEDVKRNMNICTVSQKLFCICHVDLYVQIIITKKIIITIIIFPPAACASGPKKIIILRPWGWSITAYSSLLTRISLTIHLTARAHNSSVTRRHTGVSSTIFIKISERYIQVWAPDNGRVPFPSIITMWGGGTLWAIN